MSFLVWSDQEWESSAAQLLSELGIMQGNQRVIKVKQTFSQKICARGKSGLLKALHGGKRNSTFVPKSRPQSKNVSANAI
ncbi:MAG: hypothetical protein ALECFALPRED_007576 [Alectoria fallacina]|uniref:Uncharacterized protein n=1 Tax=Alectoria fallacina TaxID=1903189 RepID=A0A8H3G8R7_9LECA|nr:MAG: hypothetical protein ALECFALPRED_007576 [Alectoria fallacina]